MVEKGVGTSMKHNVFENTSQLPEDRRKSIFDLYKQNNTMDRDFHRIKHLLNSSNGVMS